MFEVDVQNLSMALFVTLTCPEPPELAVATWSTAVHESDRIGAGLVCATSLNDADIDIGLAVFSVV